MDEQQKQTVFDPAKVIAIGIASPAASFLASRFGVAGTLIGLALSAMILTAVADFLRVYLARTSHAAAHTAVHAAHRAAHAAVTTKVPRRKGLLVVRPFRRRKRAGSKRASRGFSPHPHPRRRSVLIGSALAAGISFLLGLGVVTAIELSVGKSLACWVWDECPVEPSPADDGEETVPNTQPSVLGGTRESGEAPEVQPINPQQQPASPIGAGIPGPGVQRTNPQQEPTPPSNISEVPSEGSEEGSSLEESVSVAPAEAWDQSPSQEYVEEDQQEQQSPPSPTPEEQQPENPSNGGSSGSEQKSEEPELPEVLYTT